MPARKYGAKASEKIEKALHERKRGTLRSGSGKKVTSKKLAVAIGLSEARPGASGAYLAGREVRGPRRDAVHRAGRAEGRVAGRPQGEAARGGAGPLLRRVLSPLPGRAGLRARAARAPTLLPGLSTLAVLRRRDPAGRVRCPALLLGRHMPSVCLSRTSGFTKVVQPIEPG